MIILILLILAVLAVIFANMALKVVGAAIGLLLILIAYIIKRRRQQ